VLFHCSLTTEPSRNGDGVRTSKPIGEHTRQYVLELAATLPVVISDTEGVYLYGLDIIAQRDAYDDWYCPWASEYGTEYEEVPHFYDPGVGE
jgi:hypothetical protein